MATASTVTGLEGGGQAFGRDGREALVAALRQAYLAGTLDLTIPTDAALDRLLADLVGKRSGSSTRRLSSGGPTPG